MEGKSGRRHAWYGMSLCLCPFVQTEVLLCQFDMSVCQFAIPLLENGGRHNLLRLRRRTASEIN
jgi:hypothetical protein